MVKLPPAEEQEQGTRACEEKIIIKVILQKEKVYKKSTQLNLTLPLKMNLKHFYKWL